MHTQDLGPLSGPLLVFGGVYSNLPALERLQALAAELGIAPDRIICTGDVVGYCAEPEACVQAVQRWGIHAIAGNVELQLGQGEDDCGCNFSEGSRCDRFSRQWYPFAQQRLSADSLAWMRGLPVHLAFQYAGRRVYVVHGSFFNPSEFIFRSTPWAVKQATLDAAAAEVVLAGHCGLPFHHAHEQRLWLNAGVIGMPANDGTPRVWCLLLDDRDGELTFRHLPLRYDHAAAKARMEQYGLPRAYSDTLETGIWDNCEILPAAEAGVQGRELPVSEQLT